MEAYKPSEYTKKSNEISIFASVFSILVYVSVFYFFSLSPLTLFNNTKFWFFLCNTLIVIIALDFHDTSFASKEDIHEENIMRSHIRSVSVSTSAKPHQEYVIRTGTSKLEFKNGQCAKEEGNGRRRENPDCEMKEISIVSEEANKIIEAGDRRNSQVGSCQTVEAEREREKEEEKEEAICEEDEFSKMTDEELNSRVEEFIRRFNKQIRLQALINRNQNLK